MPHTPPSGPPVAGTALYDFTVLTSGLLPKDTYFEFGDLDDGSGSGEKFTLRAFDGAGNQITTSWLDTPFAASLSAVLSDMPWYKQTLGVYDFDGTLVPGNPTIGVWLKNNTAIGKLEVTRSSTFAAFILAAPVPEPSTAVLAVVACGLTWVLRKRFK